MTPPLVSILIPAFNAARWIRHTIESARAQSWPNKEIIVVDDGSEDGTVAVVNGMNAQVTLVRQTHAGSSAARNHAIRLSHGEFIQQLDADDLLSPDKISIQMARLDGRTDAVAVGEWARFGSDPERARFNDVADATDYSPVEWLCAECTGGHPVLQPGRWLAPRSVVMAAGAWDEQLALNNDFPYGVRLLLASNRVLSCPGGRLYHRSGNPRRVTSRRSEEAWLSSFQATELGVNAILDRVSDARTRAVCADVYQQLAYSAYLESPGVFNNATEAVRWQGGSSVEMTGGLMFSAFRSALGWKRAKRLKTLAYRAGYQHVARVKLAAFGRRTGS